MLRKMMSKSVSVLVVGLVAFEAGCSAGGDDVDVETSQAAITGGWTNLTLLNNWANYGTAFPPAVGIVDGTVTFRGAIKVSGTPVSAVAFSFINSPYAAFRTTDGNAVGMPTVLWQPGVGDVIGSMLYKGSVMDNTQNVDFFQDPNAGSDSDLGPAAESFTSLDGLAFDTTVGIGIPDDPNGHWESEYTRRQDVGGGNCPGQDCGVWIKSVNGFVRLQGFLTSTSPTDYDGFLFKLTDSTFIPGQEVQVPADLGGGTSWGAITFSPDGSVYVNGNPPAANLGVSFENVWFSKTNQGNVNLPLSNGWHANSSRTVKVGNYGGVIRFQGAITGGTSLTIGTLGTTYRPGRQVRMTAVANGPVPAIIVINTDGTMTIEGVPLSVASLYLSLDGVSFAL